MKTHFMAKLRFVCVNCHRAAVGIALSARGVWQAFGSGAYLPRTGAVPLRFITVADKAKPFVLPPLIKETTLISPTNALSPTSLVTPAVTNTPDSAAKPAEAPVSTNEVAAISG